MKRLIFSTETFTQTAKGTWESTSKSITAVMPSGDNILRTLEPRYQIIEGEYKGKKVFRLYERHLNHTEFIKRFATLDEAIDYVNS